MKNLFYGFWGFVIIFYLFYSLMLSDKKEKLNPKYEIMTNGFFSMSYLTDSISIDSLTHSLKFTDLDNKRTYIMSSYYLEILR